MQSTKLEVGEMLQHATVPLGYMVDGEKRILLISATKESPDSYQSAKHITGKPPRQIAMRAPLRRDWKLGRRM